MSNKALISNSREKFHRQILDNLMSLNADGVPSNADTSSNTSVAIAKSIIAQIGKPRLEKKLTGQSAGLQFENICTYYLQEIMESLQHIQYGKFHVAKGENIVQFQQYAHLAELDKIAKVNHEIATAIGSDYIIRPDIIISREPEADEMINENARIVDDKAALLTGFRKANSKFNILHASISCKWTLRSDRAQNARSEALNLVRNRKGKLPHVVSVTGEPMPSRIASLALGTGDIDCVYHFALYELHNALEEQGMEDSLELLNTMINGKRIKDISDLPLDLII